MSRLKWFALSIVVVALGGIALATESDELREQAERIRREAAELAKQGHLEEAENLDRESIELLEQAEHLAHDHPKREVEIRALERMLDALRREEQELLERGDVEALDHVRHEAEQVERELHALHERHHDRHAAPPQELADRLQHMRAAVEHLHHAGLHDVAEHVEERANATERELHQHLRRDDAEMVHQIMSQLDELRREVVRLREDVNELQKSR